LAAAFAAAFFESFGSSGFSARTRTWSATAGRSSANFSQIPIFTMRLRTWLEGWAPTRSQWRARSSSISINEGSSSGWYLPMFSMKRPSRGLR
jgi:hypothetical protein